MTAPSASLAQRWLQRCATDGEFRLASRYWDCHLELDLGGQVLSLALANGRVLDGAPPTSASSVRIAAPTSVWEKVLAPIPPPFFQDILPAQAMGLTLQVNEETLWQYYPAIRRAIDLLREETNAHASPV
jgi:hypothetical protein